MKRFNVKNHTINHFSFHTTLRRYSFFSLRSSSLNPTCKVSTLIMRNYQAWTLTLHPSYLFPGTSSTEITYLNAYSLFLTSEWQICTLKDIYTSGSRQISFTSERIILSVRDIARIICRVVTSPRSIVHTYNVSKKFQDQKLLYKLLPIYLLVPRVKKSNYFCSLLIFILRSIIFIREKIFKYKSHKLVDMCTYIWL